VGCSLEFATEPLMDMPLSLDVKLLGLVLSIPRKYSNEYVFPLRLPFVSSAFVDKIQFQSTYCLRSLLFWDVTECWLVGS
jgi:hypothetical protein